MSDIEKLRSLNRDCYYRTDVDNFFLMEMATADIVDTLIDEADISSTFGDDDLKLFSGDISYGDEDMDETISSEDLSAVDLF